MLGKTSLFPLKQPLPSDQDIPPMLQEPASKSSAPPQPRPAVPIGTPTAAALRSLDAETLLENMPQDAAEQIVDEWRKARASAGMGSPNARSIATYQENSRMLEIKYSNEVHSEDGILNPVDIIRRLFLHSAGISAATWRLYRSGFIYTMNERAQVCARQGQPQPTLERALAALLVVSAKPYGAGRPPATRSARDKSIPALQRHTPNETSGRAAPSRLPWPRSRPVCGRPSG
jgi:hypothetical protein